jgi:uncharacterized membrane protein YoaK (UPF0700 family)
VSRNALWTFLLAWVGGFVDAVGFLALFHLFTAHMSGNSVWLGTYLGVGNWRLGLHHLFPIPLFVLGVAVGTALVELARRSSIRAAFVPALLLEASLLALFMVCGSPFIVEDSLRPATVWGFYALAALPALAMGVQNATLRRVAGQTVHTTYITGVLNGLAEESVQVLFWLRAETRTAGLRRALRAAPAHPGLRAAVASALLWLAYVAGAISGGFAKHRWQLYALALPLAVLAVTIGVESVRPGGVADSMRRTD